MSAPDALRWFVGLDADGKPQMTTDRSRIADLRVETRILSKARKAHAKLAAEVFA